MIQAKLAINDSVLVDIDHAHKSNAYRVLAQVNDIDANRQSP